MADDTRKPKLPPSSALPKAKPAGPPSTQRATLPGDKPSAPRRPAGPPGARPSRRPPGLRRGAGGDGAPALSRKELQTDQDVRWCPGCGDYAILAQVQRTIPDLGIPKENLVFISGIGCSSRFPYYMNTYGMHSIHGRAPTIVTGLKSARPDLDVWMVTGDGDALSIGGNHLIHILRRNVNVQMLLFNNQIYGLTKGQYSPTSEAGKVTKSTPYGSIDHPFNPVAVALGSDASFVARTMDRDPKHMGQMFRRAHAHKGAALVEIYQNCNIFNDGAFLEFTDRSTKALRTVYLEHGQPLVFDKGAKGLRLDGLRFEVIDLEDGTHSVDDCLVYDETNREMAYVASQLFWQADMPRPFGVFYREERPTYEQQLQEQLDAVREKRGAGDLANLLQGPETWVVSE